MIGSMLFRKGPKRRVGSISLSGREWWSMRRRIIISIMLGVGVCIGGSRGRWWNRRDGGLTCMEVQGSVLMELTASGRIIGHYNATSSLFSRAAYELYTSFEIAITVRFLSLPVRFLSLRGAHFSHGTKFGRRIVKGKFVSH